MRPPVRDSAPPPPPKPRWQLRRLDVGALRARPLAVAELPLPAPGGPRPFASLCSADFLARQRNQAQAERAIVRALAQTAAEAARRLHAQHGFAELVLVGGLTSLPDFVDHIVELVRHAPFAVRIDAAGAFALAAGGHAALVAAGSPGGLVIDLGNASLKISSQTPPLRRLRARRVDELPRHPHDSKPTFAGARATVEATVAWLAGAILDALDAAGGARPIAPALVLALPGTVDDALVPGPSSYGFAGDATLVPRLLAALDTAGAFPHIAAPTCLVANAPELLANSLPTSSPPTLVLSLGAEPTAAIFR